MKNGFGPTNAPSSGVEAVYNIKAVVLETGLKPPTIRAWERRYGLPSPQRTEGGHRQYSQRDIDTLKWLTARQDEGMSISHAIDLWRSLVDKGRDPLGANMLAVDETRRIRQPVQGGRLEEFRAAWIDACKAFDRRQAEAVLAQAFSLFPPESVCIDVLQKGLATVGDGWYEGEATIQQEHFTSALATQKLETLIAATPPPTRPERIITATAPGDFHTFSPLLLTFMLHRRGFEVVYLGADVPARELQETIEQVQPQLIIVSAQLLHTAAALLDVSQAVDLAEVMLAYGGLAFNYSAELRRRFPGHFLGRDLQGAVDGITDLLSRRPAAPDIVEPSEAYQRAMAHFVSRRSFVDSHIWSTFDAADHPTKDLNAINEDMAESITAALKLGDIYLLGDDIASMEHLLMAYRLPDRLLRDYLSAYHQAAQLHLSELAPFVADWLSAMLEE
ncbi:MAG: MerR family transcriptional regulator [Chloroflexota bacterium]|nr:MAG: MerR family transcriptional regulator [Chloroflexota bacterium]